MSTKSGQEVAKEQKRPFFARTKVIIYPAFQIRLIVVNAVSMLAVFVMQFFLLKKSFSDLYVIGENLKLPADHSYYTLLDAQSGVIYSYFAIALILGFLIASSVIIVLSHRMAGPIVRLRGFFQAIASGGKVQANLKFRQGDFFSDLPPVINEAVVRMGGSSVSQEK